MGIIYCAQNMVNGKRYIGQTRCSLEHRRRQHGVSARLPNAQKSTAFVLALRKYGVDSFEWTIVFDDVDDEDLDEYEIDAIAVYKTLAPRGYNLQIGGNTNGTHSQEARKKMKEARRNRAPISDDTRKKMREAQRLRKPHSEETKKKMREAAKRRPPRSDQHRKKMSESQLGKTFTDEHKKKLCEAHRRRKPPSKETREKLAKALAERWAKKREHKLQQETHNILLESGKDSASADFEEISEIKRFVGLI